MQRVFIASENGITIQYIIDKVSACVKAFREISHHVARFFGDPDTTRRHKEVKFQQNMRALVEDMTRKNLQVVHPGGHFMSAPPPKKKRKDSNKPNEPRSAIADVITLGTEIWHDGKLEHFIGNTTYKSNSFRFQADSVVMFVSTKPSTMILFLIKQRIPLTSETTRTFTVMSWRTVVWEGWARRRG